MLIKVNVADIKFYKYLRESVQIPRRYLQEGLVAFADNNDHFNVDRDKSDKLPNKAGSEKLYESCGNHRSKVLIIRFYCFFYSLHVIPFVLICLTFLTLIPELKSSLA